MENPMENPMESRKSMIVSSKEWYIMMENATKMGNPDCQWYGCICIKVYDCYRKCQ